MYPALHADATWRQKTRDKKKTISQNGFWKRFLESELWWWELTVHSPQLALQAAPVSGSLQIGQSTCVSHHFG